MIIDKDMEETIMIEVKEIMEIVSEGILKMEMMKETDFKKEEILAEIKIRTMEKKEIIKKFTLQI